MLCVLVFVHSGSEIRLTGRRPCTPVSLCAPPVVAGVLISAAGAGGEGGGGGGGGEIGMKQESPERKDTSSEPLDV